LEDPQNQFKHIVSPPFSLFGWGEAYGGKRGYTPIPGARLLLSPTVF